MTHPDETPFDGAGDGRRDAAASSSDPDDGATGHGDGAPRDGADRAPLDEDAAWRAIVENYGERADLGSAAGPPDTAPPAGPSVFDRSYLEAVEAERTGRRAGDADGERGATWHDEGHFVPPEPPPMPRGTPARRLAWLGLFGSPVLMLLAVVLDWSFPGWFSLLLVASFVGGFVFLVATMERHGDDWSGDDGAVV